MNFEKLKIKNKSEARRLGIIRRYSNVAYELPEWAQEVLTSKMGNVVVSARDSFEIYLLNIKGVKPKTNYLLFCKQFAEIFERKAWVVLKKIKENREKKGEFYITNDYFWQEFNVLFTKDLPSKRKFMTFLFGVEKVFWATWNKLLKSGINLGKLIGKVGVLGLIKTKLALGILPRAKEVKWK